jgi:hypothetical protein
MSDSDEAESGAASNAAPPSSFGDSQAPSVQPAITQPAAQAPAHPFWSQKGHGKKKAGSSRKRTANGAGGSNDNAPVAGANALVVDCDDANGPAFTGISMRELEFARNRAQDGAESSVASDVEGDGRKHRKAKRAKGTANATPVDMMATATFGARRRTAADAANADVENNSKKDEDSDDEEEHEESDSDSGEESDSVAAGLDSTVRGERCIGCLFDREVVGLIDEFVRKNCGAMAETALYKAAAQHWINQVVRPRQAEGVHVPKWNWRKISSHYNLHVVDPVLQRTNAVRELGKMREFQAQCLLRVNPDGTKTLDQKSAELMLKLVALSDKQIQALDAARMPPPAPRAR